MRKGRFTHSPLSVMLYAAQWSICRDIRKTVQQGGSLLQDKLSVATPLFDGGVAKASEHDALAIKRLYNVADPDRAPRRCNNNTELCGDG